MPHQNITLLEHRIAKSEAAIDDQLAEIDMLTTRLTQGQHREQRTAALEKKRKRKAKTRNQLEVGRLIQSALGVEMLDEPVIQRLESPDGQRLLKIVVSESPTMVIRKLEAGTILDAGVRAYNQQGLKGLTGFTWRKTFSRRSTYKLISVLFCAFERAILDKTIDPVQAVLDTYIVGEKLGEALGLYLSDDAIQWLDQEKNQTLVRSFFGPYWEEEE